MFALVGGERINLGPTHWTAGFNLPSAFPYSKPLEADAMGGSVWMDLGNGRWAQDPTRGLVMREIRWAWRNIMARRWRAALTIGLLALALAAATIVFSAADSLVFLRVAYPSADRRRIFFPPFTGISTRPFSSSVAGSPSWCRPPM
jgi:hypothetical protein